MPAQKSAAISPSEAKTLFSGLHAFPVLVLAVSGGPDSTALMVLAARWRDALKTKPKLVAVTVDHGLRKESKREAAAVARLARKLKIAHRTLRWNGSKPSTGLQEAARMARYRLLGDAARRLGATHILTAHTLDDQAETVLIRMTRGSGITGLGAMMRLSALPSSGNSAIMLVRPLLDIPKLRLIATLRAAKIPYADDPSNRDPRFTRARLRGLIGALAHEGLDAQRLAQLARRLKRADVAVEKAVDRAMAELIVELPSAVAVEARRFAELPAEIALRLLGRAVAKAGDEGPVELGKLEALKSALDTAQNTGEGPFRRTLAGAVVTLKGHQLIVERAPPRGGNLLTKRGRGRASHAKTR
ncbi:MAG TPA: tRNA lysidine(34) synthetase TilS [Pseudolabrys sp.]|nr:tRNA lysidine(34) synthetase TilS [Pseudolabrys sp.]